MPRARDGRGVKTNGMRVNKECHIRIQRNEEELQHWILIYRTRHGSHFWYDDEDWEQHNRKMAEQERLVAEERARTERVEPLIQLISSAAHRGLRAKEKRLIESLSDKDAATLTNLMRDVAGVDQAANFGYGHFDD